eukprot:3932129-Rhodomonas_salina.2
MTVACSTSNWFESSSHFGHLESSGIYEEVFEENASAHEPQQEQEQEQEQEPSASNDMEAATFSHLQASTFSHPFAVCDESALTDAQQHEKQEPGTEFELAIASQHEHEKEQAARASDDVETAIFAHLQGSAFTDPFAVFDVINERTLNNAPQHAEEQESKLDSQHKTEVAPQHEQQHEQEGRASDEVEAAIFAHLQASTFSDPFAETWSQREVYSVMPQ